jgi:uncharacterized membrane protein YccC
MTAKSEFSLIPIGAKVAAALVFLAIVAGLNWFFVDRNTLGLAEVGLVTVVGAMGGLFAAAYVLLAGYVYADASRRGMPAIAWTALTVLVPNAIGFVLYFLLRKPIVHPCPNCGCGVAQDAAFCSRCGQSQLNAAVQHSSKES